MAKKIKKNRIKKQIRDSFVLTLIICAGVGVMFALISLINSPTKTFIIQESRISSEESKARVRN